MKKRLIPSNSVMRGTTVTDGHGVMCVERVGDATELVRWLGRLPNRVRNRLH